MNEVKAVAAVKALLFARDIIATSSIIIEGDYEVIFNPLIYVRYFFCFFCHFIDEAKLMLGSYDKDFFFFFFFPY